MCVCVRALLCVLCLCKVARSKILTFFNEIFEGVCRLVADYDTEVKTGAGVLNRKMKDIVTECDSFNVDEFVPLLRMHIASANPHVKQVRGVCVFLGA